MMTRNWPNGRRASCGPAKPPLGRSQVASVDGAPDPGQAGTTGTEPVRAAFSRFGRAVGPLVGGQGYHDRLRTATFAREALERSQVLKRDWNRQVERAAAEGVHVIYTDGYDRLHKELDTVSKNMLLDRGVESEISTVLATDRQGRVKPQLLRQLPRTHGGPDGPPRGAGGQGGRAGRGDSRPWTL